MDRIERDIRMLKWMLATNLAGTAFLLAQSFGVLGR